MYLFCSLCLLSVLLPDTESGRLNDEFKEFIKQFNKTYKKEEHQYRRSIFHRNMEEAKRLQKEELGTAKYGMTKFSDLTDEEFKRYYSIPVSAPPPNMMKKIHVEATPEHPTCDWRKAGVISQVKHQGECGSCWAFASVGNIEAQWAIFGHPYNFSVQQILDCGPCDAGCKGGYAWDAFITVMQESGLVTEQDYPYIGVRKSCISSQFRKIGWITNFVMLPRDEEAMKSYISNNGTITACMNSTVLKHYQRNVIHPAIKNCKPGIDHMVLLVGYSKDKNKPYWIAKNSWGTDWGERGYFRISRGGNVCGIADYPLSAFINMTGQRIPCPK
ncbi:cathepsin W-like [Hyperolius riggenbachi]|uniref:cathepsin W-like n=1 Tax=Hyperolius riggenbachi TaxID=752182 RepID=UPI0035A2C3FF